MQPFHLAIPVHDLSQAMQFYHHLLRCPLGRQTAQWIDFDFHGHQLTVHLTTDIRTETPVNPVDAKLVPIRHFGIVLDWAQWHELRDYLRSHDIAFLVEPCIRFQGQTGEQATLFIADPSGNALEFKSFKDMERLFAPYAKEVS